MGFYGFNYYSFLFMLPALIISLYAQAKVQSTFQKFSRLSSHRNITGSEAARQVLLRGGVTDVQITTIAGNLTDHFDPTSKVIDVYKRQLRFCLIARLIDIINIKIMSPWLCSFYCCWVYWIPRFIFSEA